MQLFPAFAPGAVEITIIVAIGVLLFGASRIPKMARSMGEATKEFERGKVESEKELEKMRE